MRSIKAVVGNIRQKDLIGGEQAVIHGGAAAPEGKGLSLLAAGKPQGILHLLFCPRGEQHSLISRAELLYDLFFGRAQRGVIERLDFAVPPSGGLCPVRRCGTAQEELSALFLCLPDEPGSLRAGAADQQDQAEQAVLQPPAIGRNAAGGLCFQRHMHRAPQDVSAGIDKIRQFLVRKKRFAGDLVFLVIFEQLQLQHGGAQKAAAVPLDDIQQLQLFLQQHSGVSSGFLQAVIEGTDGVGDAKDLLPYSGDLVFGLLAQLRAAEEDLAGRGAADLHKDHLLLTETEALLADTAERIAVVQQKNALLRRAVRTAPGQLPGLRRCSCRAAVVRPEQITVCLIAQNGISCLLKLLADQL